MSTGTNLLVILIVFNIVLNIPCLSDVNSNFCYPTGLTMIGGLLTANADLRKVTVSTNFTFFWSTVVLTSVATAIITGLITWSGQTALVTGMAAFLLSFASLPVSIFQFTGMPFEITLLIGGTLSVMIMLSLISFIRGSEW